MPARVENRLAMHMQSCVVSQSGKLPVFLELIYGFMLFYSWAMNMNIFHDPVVQADPLTMDYWNETPKSVLQMASESNYVRIDL